MEKIIYEDKTKIDDSKLENLEKMADFIFLNTVTLLYKYNLDLKDCCIVLNSISFLLKKVVKEVCLFDINDDELLDNFIMKKYKTIINDEKMKEIRLYAEVSKNKKKE